MAKILLKAYLLSLMAVACQKKSFICPAYSSYFIHDSQKQNELFSPFTVDSLNAESDEPSRTDEDTKNNGKYQPKSYTIEKQKHNGLLTKWKAAKPRNVTYIEMQVLALKGQSRYSNIDSSATNNDGLPLNKPVDTDTL